MHKHAPIAAACAIRRIAAAGLALLVLLGLPFTYVSAIRADDSIPATAAPALTAEDLAIFLDGLIPVLLRRDDIAGVVIAVVKDGKLLLARGHGYADVERRSQYRRKPLYSGPALFQSCSPALR